ncbi:MAG: NlpC/P60 family protein [Lachnospiraceae bacterium]|nr:NlpC/P60 family protein [Lachnospiraceae bacterium]
MSKKLKFVDEDKTKILQNKDKKDGKKKITTKKKSSVKAKEVKLTEESIKRKKNSKLRFDIHDPKEEQTGGKKKQKKKLGTPEQGSDGQIHLKKEHIKKSLEKTFFSSTKAFLVSQNHKIVERKNEDDNVSIKAANDGIYGAQKTVDTAFSIGYSRKLKRSKQVQKLEKIGQKEEMDRLYVKEQMENPNLNSNPFSKWMQKRELKKEYAKRKAEKEAFEGGSQGAKETANAATSLIEKIENSFHYFFENKDTLVKEMLIFFIIFTLFTTVTNSCSILAGGVLTVVTATSWPADDDDITKAEAYYTKLEAKLQKKINDMESSGSYDEYNYNIDEIGHDPVELISYLCAKYGDFHYGLVIKHELNQIFKKQYQLKKETFIGTKTITSKVKKGQSLGNVVTSGYCNCVLCCGKWAGGNTATGTKPRADHTIAVDAKNPTVPLGTEIIMNGTLYKAEDTGAFAKYGVDFDIYFDSHTTAQNWGHKTFTAYYAGGKGEEIEVKTSKNVKECNVTLISKNLKNILKNRLNDEQKQMYQVYVESKGNRQFYGTPIDANWHENISGIYGYRLDEATGKVKKYEHMDLCVPEGTELLAVMNGTVTMKNSNSLILEDSDGYRIKFEGIKNISVSYQDTVKEGQKIAKVDRYERLQIEFIVKGVHYNPYFYMTTGTKHLYTDGAYEGTSTKAAKLIQEAKKYLGTPYVWGGYSPSGFDCSGFVSYAINHCGAGWNFGRLTANGLKEKCRIIPKSQMRPGDLIFFKGTYNTKGASHVGIYLGDGKMIHSGHPCQISTINTSYWQQHWYCVGRLP